VHIAGHAGWTNDSPALELAAPEGESPVLTSGDLQQWLEYSSVRFVYLSCCGGASVPLARDASPGWRTTLCRCVIEAGVPEVAGYFWPVDDSRAAEFAFLQNFEAPEAMLSARRSTRATDPVWAGSVIVKTARPPSRR
jgi:CHAT domain-containing protein